MLDRQQIAATVLSDSSHQFGDYTVLAPDVSVHLPPRPSGKGFFQGSPEVALEILLPSNTARELDRKARIYWGARRAGGLHSRPDGTQDLFDQLHREWIEVPS